VANYDVNGNLCTSITASSMTQPVSGTITAVTAITERPSYWCKYDSKIDILGNAAGILDTVKGHNPQRL